MDLQNNLIEPNIRKIQELLSSENYAEAELTAKQHLEESENNVEILKFLAIALRSQEKIKEFLQVMEKVATISSLVTDKELYIFELIGLSLLDQALQQKIDYMNDQHHRDTVKRLLQKKNFLIQRTHQFYVSYSLDKCKEKLHFLAKSIVTEKIILERIDYFINHLFELKAFRQRSKFELHNPSFIAYAGLSEQPYIDAKNVVDLSQYQQFKEAIKIEVMNILDTEKTVPYVKNKSGLPEGLAHLKENPDWSSLSLFESDRLLVPKAESLMTLLRDNLDLADCKPMGPEVMISILKPDTHITPHYGISNIKQTLHIPIVLPEGDIAIKVGGIEKKWSEDYPLVFDDSFLHEAWNRSPATRIVLIVDIWHPDLTEEERSFMAKAVPLISQWQQDIRL